MHSLMASILSLGFWGLTIRRVRSVGSTLPGLGRWKRPYLSAELISTPMGPLQPIPANFAVFLVALGFVGSASAAVVAVLSSAIDKTNYISLAAISRGTGCRFSCGGRS